MLTDRTRFQEESLWEAKTEHEGQTELAHDPNFKLNFTELVTEEFKFQTGKVLLPRQKSDLWLTQIA